ncbi:MAG: hypothetical protein ABIH49_01030 [archaeon]
MEYSGRKSSYRGLKALGLAALLGAGLVFGGCLSRDTEIITPPPAQEEQVSGGYSLRNPSVPLTLATNYMPEALSSHKVEQQRGGVQIYSLSSTDINLQVFATRPTLTSGTSLQDNAPQSFNYDIFPTLNRYTGTIEEVIAGTSPIEQIVSFGLEDIGKFLTTLYADSADGSVPQGLILNTISGTTDILFFTNVSGQPLKFSPDITGSYQRAEYPQDNNLIGIVDAKRFNDGRFYFVMLPTRSNGQITRNPYVLSTDSNLQDKVSETDIPLGENLGTLFPDTPAGSLPLSMQYKIVQIEGGFLVSDLLNNTVHRFLKDEISGGYQRDSLEVRLPITICVDSTNRMYVFKAAHHNSAEEFVPLELEEMHFDSRTTSHVHTFNSLPEDYQTVLNEDVLFNGEILNLSRGFNLTVEIFEDADWLRFVYTNTNADEVSALSFEKEYSPTVQVQSPTEGQSSNSPLTVQHNEADLDDNLDPSGCSAIIDGGTPQPIVCNTPFDLNLQNGAHTLEIDAVDTLGNVGSSEVINFTITQP